MAKLWWLVSGVRVLHGKYCSTWGASSSRWMLQSPGERVFQSGCFTPQGEFWKVDVDYLRSEFFKVDVAFPSERVPRWMLDYLGSEFFTVDVGMELLHWKNYTTRLFISCSCFWQANFMFQWKTWSQKYIFWSSCIWTWVWMCLWGCLVYEYLHDHLPSLRTDSLQSMETAQQRGFLMRNILLQTSIIQLLLSNSINAKGGT